MSNLRSFQRHLNPQKVWFANQVSEEKLKIARQVVMERAKKDAAFAADVLKAVGDALPKEIKEACEASVAAPKVTTVKVDESGLSQETMPEKCYQIDKEMGLVAADKRADELWKPTSEEIGIGETKPVSRGVSPILPEDPLLVMKAPDNNYPENQGMGAALGKAMEEKLVQEEMSNKAADIAQVIESKKVSSGETQEEQIARIQSAGIAAKIDSEIFQDMIAHPELIIMDGLKAKKE